MASTSSRLSADRQISTSLVARASAIALGVNWRNLSWVSSMTWMVSETTMQAPVSSLNCGFFVAPIRLVEGGRAARSVTGRLMKIILDMDVFLRLRFDPYSGMSYVMQL